MKKPLLILRLLLTFIFEVIKANIQVALWIPRSNAHLRPAFIRIPLTIRHELGLVSLAQMITLTPGTLSLEFTPEHDFLLVHVIHAPDPEAVIREIKDVFERPLIEIFGEGGTT